MKKYSAKSISDLIIYEVCENRGYSLLTSKMLHLLYYSDIWYMMISGKYLFRDKFQAGIFCPMNGNVLESFTELKNVHDILTNRDLSSDFDIGIYDSEIIKHVNLVIDEFMQWSSDALTTKMRSDYPWILARDGYETNERCEVNIDKKVCRVYYRGIDKIIKKCNMVHNNKE